MERPLQTSYVPANDDCYILIDISDPAHFEKFVDLERVSEVIDHHPGFEQYWQQRIGEHAQIELIGAACTQVYERWIAAGHIDKMSTTTARLLVAGILDNTLNFGAHVTTDRDKAAYEDLFERAELPENWTAQYFAECQESILVNLKKAITNDTKMLTFSSLPWILGVGQLVIWDAKTVLHGYSADMEGILSEISEKWFLNVVNVSERKSYFVCKDAKIQAWLTKLLGVRFEGAVAQADRLWLRKEIIRQDIMASSKRG